MSLTTLLIIVLVIALLGGLPQAGLHNYGYGPSGLLLLIVIILLLSGRIG